MQNMVNFRGTKAFIPLLKLTIKISWMLLAQCIYTWTTNVHFKKVIDSFKQ